MAISIYTSVKIYDEQFQGAFVETVMQNVAAFNAASQGALVYNTRPLMGHYEKEAFWDEIINANSGIARRDISKGSSAVTPIALTQDEFIGVKLNRKNGPYDVTLDAFRKAIDAGASAEQVGRDFSRVVGIQTAKEMPREMLDRSLAAIEGKLDATTGNEYDISATVGATMKSEYLVSGLQKFGDAAGDIVMWVMHSKVYFDLLNDQIADAIYRANGVQVMNGVPATLGRPVLVTDSASLLASNGVSSGVDCYSTLGLTRGAATITMSEPPIAALSPVQTGGENLYLEFQAEYAYNLKLRGCQWDTTNGGLNPTDAAVATATNWDTAIASGKLLPGVIVKTR